MAKAAASTTRSAPRRRAGAPAPRRRVGAPAPLAAEVRRRLGWLVGMLGNNRAAELLGVNRSQPSRWRSGVEGLSGESLRAVLDLDYVVARLHQLWTPDVAEIWLQSPNAHLGGATPLDVLRQRGAREVLLAIDAEAEGAYA